MIHVFDEAGDPVLPLASQKQRIGPQIASVLHAYGIAGSAATRSQS
jgi:hypothetical protein